MLPNHMKNTNEFEKKRINHFPNLEKYKGNKIKLDNGHIRE